MTLYRQLSEADSQARVQGILIDAFALSLGDQHRLCDEAKLSPSRLESVAGIRVVEAQFLHPASAVPENLKEVN